MLFPFIQSFTTKVSLFNYFLSSSSFFSSLHFFPLFLLSALLHFSLFFCHHRRGCQKPCYFPWFKQNRGLFALSLLSSSSYYYPLSPSLPILPPFNEPPN